MQNQLLAWPCTDLPQVLMSISSLSLFTCQPDSHMWPALVLQMDFTQKEHSTDSCLAIYRAFVFFLPLFHGPLSKCNQTQSAVTANRGSPPWRKTQPIICFLSFTITKWGGTSEEYLVKIRNIPRVLFCHQESKGVYIKNIYSLYKGIYIFLHLHTHTPYTYNNT